MNIVSTGAKCEENAPGAVLKSIVHRPDGHQYPLPRRRDIMNDFGNWEGANKAPYGACELCGKAGERRIIHYIGPPGDLDLDEINDHMAICRSCFNNTNIPRDRWYGCGCGG